MNVMQTGVYTERERERDSERVREWESEQQSVFTSSIFGMMSFSHCLRKQSLSKLGSAFRISVSTSDISVLEKRPPGKTNNISRGHSREIPCSTECRAFGLFISSSRNFSWTRSGFFHHIPNCRSQLGLCCYGCSGLANLSLDIATGVQHGHDM